MSAYKEYLLNVWKSRLSRHGHFTPSTPLLEDRQIRLARFGMIASTVLIALMGIAEVAFLGLLLWYLIR